MQLLVDKLFASSLDLTSGRESPFKVYKNSKQISGGLKIVGVNQCSLSEIEASSNLGTILSYKRKQFGSIISYEKNGVVEMWNIEDINKEGNQKKLQYKLVHEFKDVNDRSSVLSLESILPFPSVISVQISGLCRIWTPNMNVVSGIDNRELDNTLIEGDSFGVVLSSALISLLPQPSLTEKQQQQNSIHSSSSSSSSITYMFAVASFHRIRTVRMIGVQNILKLAESEIEGNECEDIGVGKRVTFVDEMLKQLPPTICKSGFNLENVAFTHKWIDYSTLAIIDLKNFLTLPPTLSLILRDEREKKIKQFVFESDKGLLIKLVENQIQITSQLLPSSESNITSNDLNMKINQDKKIRKDIQMELGMEIVHGRVKIIPIKVLNELVNVLISENEFVLVETVLLMLIKNVSKRYSDLREYNSKENNSENENKNKKQDSEEFKLQMEDIFQFSLDCALENGFVRTILALPSIEWGGFCFQQIMKNQSKQNQDQKESKIEIQQMCDKIKGGLITIPIQGFRFERIKDLEFDKNEFGFIEHEDEVDDILLEKERVRNIESENIVISREIPMSNIIRERNIEYVLFSPDHLVNGLKLIWLKQDRRKRKEEDEQKQEDNELNNKFNKPSSEEIILSVLYITLGLNFPYPHTNTQLFNLKDKRQAFKPLIDWIFEQSNSLLQSLLNWDYQMTLESVIKPSLLIAAEFERENDNPSSDRISEYNKSDQTEQNYNNTFEDYLEIDIPLPNLDLNEDNQKQSNNQGSKNTVQQINSIISEILIKKQYQRDQKKKRELKKKEIEEQEKKILQRHYYDVDLPREWFVKQIKDQTKTQQLTTDMKLTQQQDTQQQQFQEPSPHSHISTTPHYHQTQISPNSPSVQSPMKIQQGKDNKIGNGNNEKQQDGEDDDDELNEKEEKDDNLGFVSVKQIILKILNEAQMIKGLWNVLFDILMKEDKDKYKDMRQNINIITLGIVCLKSSGTFQEIGIKIGEIISDFELVINGFLEYGGIRGSLEQGRKRMMKHLSERNRNEKQEIGQERIRERRNNKSEFRGDVDTNLSLCLFGCNNCYKEEDIGKNNEKEILKENKISRVLQDDFEYYLMIDSDDDEHLQEFQTIFDFLFRYISSFGEGIEQIVEMKGNEERIIIEMEQQINLLEDAIKKKLKQLSQLSVSKTALLILSIIDQSGMIIVDSERRIKRRKRIIIRREKKPNVDKNEQQDIPSPLFTNTNESEFEIFSQSEEESSILNINRYVKQKEKWKERILAHCLVLLITDVSWKVKILLETKKYEDSNDEGEEYKDQDEDKQERIIILWDNGRHHSLFENLTQSPSQIFSQSLIQTNKNIGDYFELSEKSLEIVFEYLIKVGERGISNKTVNEKEQNKLINDDAFLFSLLQQHQIHTQLNSPLRYLGIGQKHFGDLTSFLFCDVVGDIDGAKKSLISALERWMKETSDLILDLSKYIEMNSQTHLIPFDSLPQSVKDQINQQQNNNQSKLNEEEEDWFGIRNRAEVMWKYLINISPGISEVSITRRVYYAALRILEGIKLWDQSSGQIISESGQSIVSGFPFNQSLQIGSRGYQLQKRFELSLIPTCLIREFDVLYLLEEYLIVIGEQFSSLQSFRSGSLFNLRSQTQLEKLGGFQYGQIQNRDQIIQIKFNQLNSGLTEKGNEIGKNQSIEIGSPYKSDTKGSNIEIEWAKLIVQIASSHNISNTESELGQEIMKELEKKIIVNIFERIVMLKVSGSEDKEKNIEISNGKTGVSLSQLFIRVVEEGKGKQGDINLVLTTMLDLLQEDGEFLKSAHGVGENANAEFVDRLLWEGRRGRLFEFGNRRMKMNGNQNQRCCVCGIKIERIQNKVNINDLDVNNESGRIILYGCGHIAHEQCVCNNKGQKKMWREQECKLCNEINRSRDIGIAQKFENNDDDELPIIEPWEAPQAGIQQEGRSGRLVVEDAKTVQLRISIFR
ncbi:MAG: hypothetical protein EZS28_004538 [Streblomastix strix]|uniref:RING-type domain-containing protein n=1 Tax=Streblomastix strix TaxID=222440 RepID=A0A5J4WYM4_9EUKA|nr:MAG: hypothetical protein EZS28_004538 [Streblomastix strix]